MLNLLLWVVMFGLTGAALMGFFGVVPQVIAIGVLAFAIIGVGGFG